MTRLLLVRHGATQLTAEDRFSGDVGVDLSDEGREQVRRLARRLADEPVRAVYCSPLSRTVETAEILAAPHRLSLVRRDGLREISHGHWEGLIRREVEERFPDEYASWEADPFAFAPDGGESGVAVLARALPVIRSIVVNHPEETVLVVSHKATLRLLLSSLLGFDARGYRDRLDQAPACLNVVDFKGPVRARLMLFNDVSHYRDEPRTPGANLSQLVGPMILVGQYDSPYVRRVAISLHLLGLPFTRNPLSGFADAAAMRQINPLGRIPSLILDTGEVIIDSAAILYHLDEFVGPERALLPRAGAERRRALRVIALATGVVDKAGAIVYERTLRPPEKVHLPWIERCRIQLASGLAALEAEPSLSLGDRPMQPGVTAACMLGYLRHRLPEALTDEHRKLAAFAAACARLEAFAATEPAADEVMPPPL